MTNQLINGRVLSNTDFHNSFNPTGPFDMKITSQKYEYTFPKGNIAICLNVSVNGTEHTINYPANHDLATTGLILYSVYSCTLIPNGSGNGYALGLAPVIEPEQPMAASVVLANHQYSTTITNLIDLPLTHRSESMLELVRLNDEPSCSTCIITLPEHRDRTYLIHTPTSIRDKHELLSGIITNMEYSKHTSKATVKFDNQLSQPLTVERIAELRAMHELQDNSHIVTTNKPERQSETDLILSEPQSITIGIIEFNQPDFQLTILQSTGNTILGYATLPDGTIITATWDDSGVAINKSSNRNINLTPLNRKYTVTLEFDVQSIDFCDVEVIANSPEQARELAHEQYLIDSSNMDFYSGNHMERTIAINNSEWEVV